MGGAGDGERAGPHISLAEYTTVKTDVNTTAHDLQVATSWAHSSPLLSLIALFAPGTYHSASHSPANRATQRDLISDSKATRRAVEKDAWTITTKR